MKKEKNTKKKLLIVSGMSLLTVLGGTLAYFRTTTDIENIFKTGKYEHQIVEEFTSPTNWTPGTTTKKEVKVTNTGNVDMAVRASYTESWKDANGNDLALTTPGNVQIALINFNNDWSKDDDGYYYYGRKDNLTKLAAGETSTSFISGVTFNYVIQPSLNKEVSEDGKTITYTSKGTGYDNATYKLTVKLETVQYDHASNIWHA